MYAPAVHLRILIVVLLLAACCGGGLSGEESPAVDAWLGRWNGPEGTFLESASVKSLRPSGPTRALDFV